ncbi:TetR family transcriptional regulator [Amphibacillus cookii]|uniref:TetR family transcriptional regulator n=1 Tax=Amphibacillus cookii TaxID=767787 RepID=UPI00195E476B|nr:TetR family transcriptional regulator [Amphibacillus cookii]MBM7542314.1 AcrR family transcriptional regulator [Amphibacillus cookii]
MPKQTFFNLDEQKQAKLIDALKKEFSRVPVHDASIANIVKTAQIPRGSFYQYFVDKEDAFLFLLESYGEQNKERFLISLEQTKGDLFASFTDMFEGVMREISNEEQHQFFRNVFLNMNHKMEQAFTHNKKKDDFEKIFEDFEKRLLDSHLAISTKEELRHVIKILLVVTFHNVIEVFAEQVPIEQAYENYQQQLKLLKNGLIKS